MNEVHRHARRYGVRILLTLLPLATLSVPAGLGSHSVGRALPGSLPPAGFKVPSKLSDRLPRGGVYIVISQWCRTCTSRWWSYFHLVDKHKNYAMIVEVADTAGVMSYISDEWPETVGRVIVVKHGRLGELLGVHVTPAMIQVDRQGVVLSAKLTNAGWLRDVATPSHVASRWRQVLSRGYQAAVRQRVRP